ncbi:response regulator [bacterium]|nr:response regulator [bacterium]
MNECRPESALAVHIATDANHARKVAEALGGAPAIEYARDAHEVITRQDADDIGVVVLDTDGLANWPEALRNLYDELPGSFVVLAGGPEAGAEAWRLAMSNGDARVLAGPADARGLALTIRAATERWCLAANYRALEEEYRKVDQKLDYIQRQYLYLKEYTERILNNMRSGLLVTDKYGRVTMANQSAENILRYPPDTLVGRSISDVLDASLQPAGESEPETPSLVHRAEVGATRYDGRPIHVGYSTSTLEDATGKPLGTIIVFSDVTEVNQLKTQLIQTEKMAGIGTLAGGIAHEFNNLIGGMLGYAQLAEASGRTEDYRKSNEVVFQSAKRAKTIISNLLTFARRVPNVIERSDLRELVEQVISLVKRDLQKENVAVEIDVDDGCVIHTDLGQFQQVLLNLIINAKHAMIDRKGGTLTIVGRQEGDRLRVVVKDTGVGIPDDILPRIFEPFFTTKGSIGSGAVAGSGLGLSISYGIISELGGEILVDTVPGEGSTFTVIVPAAAMEPAAPEPDIAEDVPEETFREAGKRRILVVDDEPMIRELLENLLLRDGHRVAIAGNGFAAVEQARAFRPDIAIIDAQMPGISGKETYQELRREHPEINAVMITGQVGGEYEDFAGEMHELGIGILKKPFDIHDIRVAIQRLS